MGKVYDVDNPLAHVDNDKDTHKDKYKDTQRQRQEKTFKKKVLMYIGIIAVLRYIYIGKQAYEITFDKDKDKMLKRPNMCYIFEKQEVQRFQI